jgi:hypothetical protein
VAGGCNEIAASTAHLPDADQTDATADEPTLADAHTAAGESGASPMVCSPCSPEAAADADAEDDDGDAAEDEDLHAEDDDADDDLEYGYLDAALSAEQRAMLDQVRGMQDVVDALDEDGTLGVD